MLTTSVHGSGLKPAQLCPRVECLQGKWQNDSPITSQTYAIELLLW